MAKWTSEQTLILREQYPTCKAKDLVKTFDRNKLAIRRQAERLGIKKNKGFKIKKEIETIKMRIYSEENSFSSFICGFVAGEGSFVQCKKNKNSKLNSYVFSIGLANDDRKILEDIKAFFGVGIINEYPPRKEGQKGSVTYHINGAVNLIKIIIPFFDKYGLFSTRKQKQYLIWKEDLLNYAYGRGWILNNYSPNKSELYANPSRGTATIYND